MSLRDVGHIEHRLLVFRIVAEQRGSLSEIEQHWSIDDVDDMNDHIDAWHEAQKELSESKP